MRRVAQLLLASSCAASAQAQVCFEAVEPTAALPAGPVAQAQGDLDGDGDPDLVIACRDANSIAVLFNAGDGTFAAPVIHAVGLSPRALFVSDLDADGALDVVVANYASSSLSLFWNQGGGVLTSGGTLSVGQQPHSIFCGNLDTDGLPDLAVLTNNPAAVCVFQRSGPRTFLPYFPYPAGSIPIELAGADVDLDGDFDLLVANRNDLVLLPGHGSGTFATALHFFPPSNATFDGLAAADLDGDGDPDVVLCAGSHLRTVRNTGALTLVWWNDVDSGHPLDSVSIGDSDRDGDLDVLATSANAHGLVSLSNDGLGNLGPIVAYGATAGASGARLVDLDADGWLDASVLDAGGATLSVLANRRDGTFESVPALELAKGPFHLAHADLDLDGDVDLVATTNGGSGGVAVFESHGDGTFAAGVELGGPFAFATDVAVADVTGDGLPDLAVTFQFPGSVGVYAGLGACAFAPPSFSTVASNAYEVVAADLDADGDVDLATASGLSAGGVSVLVNPGNGLFGSAVFTLVPNARAITAADVDGDGDLDLIASNWPSLPNTFTVLIQTAPGSFVARPPTTGAGPAIDLAAADVDLDGDVDVVVAKNAALPSIAVLTNDGTGTFTAGASPSGAPQAVSVELADFDGDGLPEIVAGYEGDRVVVFQNLGGGSFTTLASIPVSGAVTGVASFDLDGDGDLDVATTASGLLAIPILRNCTASATTVCAGDGSGVACPCGNDSPAGSGLGCRSSIGIGARLDASGVAWITRDELELRASGMPNSLALFLQSTGVDGGGMGSVVADGVRCVDGALIRLGTRAIAGGAAQYPDATGAPVHARGLVTTPGTRYYQVWYRNAANFCTPATSNWTNGVRVRWAP